MANFGNFLSKTFGSFGVYPLIAAAKGIRKGAKNAWNWFSDKALPTIVGHGNDASLTDVMDENHNFQYNDTSTGLNRLWNVITGQASRDYNTAVTNYTNQYNNPTTQRELAKQAGLNDNLQGAGGFQTLADTSAIGLNGSTFNDAFQNMSGIWNMFGDVMNGIKTGADIVGQHAKNKAQKLDNIFKELDLPRAKFNNLIYTNRNENWQMFTEEDWNKANASSLSAQVTATDANNYLNPNENGQSNADLKAEMEYYNNLFSIAWSKYRSDTAIDNDKFDTQVKKQQEHRAKERHTADMAESAFRDAEEKAKQEFYSKNNFYPNWNVSLDSEAMQRVVKMVDQSNMPDWMKAFAIFGLSMLSK